MNQRSAHGKDAPPTRVDVAALGALLKRIEALVSAEDFAQVQALTRTLIEVTRLVREHGATIKRLRRLLGQVSSEKTANVVGSSATNGAAPDPPAAEHDAATSAPERSNTSTDEAQPAASDDRQPSERRPGHGRLPATAYEDAEHVAVEHEHLHIGDACPDCQRGRLFELADPATHVRIFGQAPLVSLCFDCQRLRCSACGLVHTALAPEQGRGPKYSESAIGMIAILRYGAGLPMNRLARLQTNWRTPVPVSTQWEVLRDNSEALRPLFAELRRHAANAPIVHNDDTYARIVSLMGKSRAALLAAGDLADPERTGIFTTGIVATTSDGVIPIFCTGPRHAGENLERLLNLRDTALGPPIQMSDGLDRNLPKHHETIPANCLPHARRHFVDEANSFPDECRHVLEQLRHVFYAEKLCRRDGLVGQARLKFHQARSAPIMEALRAHMQAQLDQKLVEPNSGLGGAYNYMLKRWDKLTAFLRLADAPLENNIVERALKKAIIHRKNSLFFRTERGADVGDLYMSIIYAAELNGVNPFQYLADLLRHQKAVAANPAAWLPWAYRDAPPTAQPRAAPLAV